MRSFVEFVRVVSAKKCKVTSETEEKDVMKLKRRKGERNGYVDRETIKPPLRDY